MLRNRLPYIIFIFVVVASLINTNLFILPSLSAYLFFLLTSSLLLLVISLAKPNTNGYPLPFWGLLLILLYVLIGGLTQRVLGFEHIYLLMGGGLFWSLFSMFTTGKVSSSSTSLLSNYKFLAQSIIVVSVIESFVVVLQYFNVLPSLNNYFTCTGTWINPNVTAMFLAMTWPLLLSEAVKNKKWIFVVLAFITLSAILLLQCRTAIIGVFTGTLFYLLKTTKLLKKIPGYISVFVIFLFTVSVLMLGGTYLYNLKKESSEGRLHIWKTSLNISIKKPVFGHGWGSFEQVYNIEQANSFIEINNFSDIPPKAQFVRMAYNEPLQILVEGGLFGLILFFLFLLSLFSKKRIKGDLSSDENEILIIAHSGIIAFVSMSLVNFTLQAIPVFVIFILYTALCASFFIPISFTLSNKNVRYVVRFSIIGISIFMLYLSILFTKSFGIVGQAVLSTNEGNYQEAVNKLVPLKNALRNSEFYWKNLSFALYRAKKYTESIESCEKALRFSSNPDLFILKGNSYYRLNNIEQAKINYFQARNIAPFKAEAYYLLMNAFAKQGDSSKAKINAEIIISLPNRDQASLAYYNDAVHLLKNFNQ